MSIFAEINRVTVNVRLAPGKEQGITLLIRDDLSVEQAIAYQERTQAAEGNNFEVALALLLAYVECWEVDGADSAVPWEEATLRRMKMSIFEPLVKAVTDQIAPAEDAEDSDDSEDSSKNA